MIFTRLHIIFQLSTKALIVFSIVLFVFGCDDGIKDTMTSEKQTIENKQNVIENDITAPVVGDSGTLTPFSIFSERIRLKFTRASDDVTIQEDLHYKIYLSDNPNIATYADMETNGDPYIDGWIENINNVKIKGLNSGSTYYINVAVTDRAGNVAPYTMVSFTTAP